MSRLQEIFITIKLIKCKLCQLWNSSMSSLVLLHVFLQCSATVAHCGGSYRSKSTLYRIVSYVNLLTVDVAAALVVVVVAAVAVDVGIAFVKCYFTLMGRCCRCRRAAKPEANAKQNREKKAKKPQSTTQTCFFSFLSLSLSLPHPVRSYSPPSLDPTGL